MFLNYHVFSEMNYSYMSSLWPRSINFLAYIYTTVEHRAISSDRFPANIIRWPNLGPAVFCSWSSIVEYLWATHSIVCGWPQNLLTKLFSKQEPQSCIATLIRSVKIITRKRPLVWTNLENTTCDPMLIYRWVSVADDFGADWANVSCVLGRNSVAEILMVGIYIGQVVFWGYPHSPGCCFSAIAHW